MSLPPTSPTIDQLAALRVVQAKVVMRAQSKVIAAQADLIAAQDRLRETDEAIAACPDPLPIIAYIKEGV